MEITQKKHHFSQIVFKQDIKKFNVISGKIYKAEISKSQKGFQVYAKSLNDNFYFNDSEENLVKLFKIV
jgi:hypothetical protein